MCQEALQQTKAFDLNEEKLNMCIIHPLKLHLGQKDLNPRQCKYMITR